MAEHLDEQKQRESEHRAPGWVIRCTRCGFTEPWGKYGVRIGGASYGKYTIGRCSRCKRICCHAIEKAKPR